MKNFVFVVLGWTAISLGIIGIFLPLLPTTVFLLLGSYFFMKGSPKLNEKLLNNKYLGTYIRNYRENKGMPLRAKISAIFLLWTSISLTIIYFVDNLFIQILLFAIAIGVSTYLSRLKTIKVSS